jgi:hypothetical protein
LRKEEDNDQYNVTLQDKFVDLFADARLVKFPARVDDGVDGND